MKIVWVASIVTFVTVGAVRSCAVKNLNQECVAKAKSCEVPLECQR